MPKGKDGLAELLLEEAEQEARRRREAVRKAMTEERRRRELEERRRLEKEEGKRERLLAIRRRRLREKRERRELERKLKKATYEANSQLQAMKREKIEEYVGYCKKYRAMEDAGKMISDPPLRRAWDEACKKTREKWPSPYNKCIFTEMERTAFISDPYQSAMWIGLLRKKSENRDACIPDA